MSDRLLTLEQLADMLGLTPEYLQRMKNVWGIPEIRISRKTIRYSESQINLWLANREQNKESR